MRRVGTLGLAALGLGLMLGRPSAATPDVIELKDGHQVTGEVVAEKPGALYVDLGFDVLRIPRDTIARRSKAGDAPAASAAAPTAEADSQGFYHTAPSRQRPVEELVRQYGEAVILVETPGGLGSGFIVNDDGYAVTNNHVIEGETRIAVVLFQNSGSGLVRKRIEKVEIVALNPFVDLALLKLPPQKDLKLGHVNLGRLEDLNVGDAAFAVGNPLGLERSVSQGIISSLNRVFDGQIYIQTDAAINPGNSGGPLFNMKGEVVGVTNMGAAFRDNIGFAIPINTVKEFLRNRNAFAYNKNNPNTGFFYLDPPHRLRPGTPPGLKGKKTAQAADAGR